MSINNISTEDLEKELLKRKLSPGIWTVVKYLRDDKTSRFGEPKPIHLVIDSNGNTAEVQLVGNIYNKDLNDRQPECSDEDPNWDSDWEEYENFSINYFLDKKVEISSFDPIKITKII